MQTSDFWQLISKSKEGNNELAEQIQFIASYLSLCPDEETLEFDRILKKSLLSESHFYKLSFAFAAVCPDLEWDENTFHELKAWLILQGKDSFYSVSENPDQLASFEKIEKCQSLLSLVDNEWMRRHNMPSPIKIEVASLKGEPLTHEELEKFIFDDLERIFPHLFRKARPMREIQWHPRDRQLLHELKEMGCDFSTPKEVDHVFICKDANSAKKLANELLRMRHGKVKHTGKADLLFTEKISLRLLTRKTQMLYDLSEKFGAIYDGWGTDASKSAF